jgi:aspartyl-tRNA(Asn)/glutamyl-tRNA(Gln) amidotransferase subunit A
LEELDLTLNAIERSDLNCFSFVDVEQAREAAQRADVSLPLGGVPAGVKELDHVLGWPDTSASLVFKDRIAVETSTSVDRFRSRGGAVLVGLTTASEYGGLDISVTKLNGVTHNPWRHGRTVGGSSGGSAAAVAGGLVTVCTAADGGGSIRIPAAHTGLFGMKGTYGRVPRGPSAYSRPSTEVFGCLARSVRDTARYWDVCAGTDARDPWSLPSHGRWEADLGTRDLSGLKVAVIPDLSGVDLAPGMQARLRSTADALIAATGMTEVHVDISLPNLAAEWMMGNISTLLADLGDRWPACAEELTDAIADGLFLSQAFYNLNTAAIAEKKRLQVNAAMAAAFEQADIIIAATTSSPPFAADQQMSNQQHPTVEKVLTNKAARRVIRGGFAAIRTIGGAAPKLPHKLIETATEKLPDLVNMGGLTIVSNIYGNPAASIPAGLVDGLPIGMQVLGRHHQDELLFDLGLVAEREIGWPITAPTR